MSNLKTNHTFKNFELKILSIVKYKLCSKVSGESFINSSKLLTDPLVSSIKKITKVNPKLSTSGGTSDARFIHQICPVVEFGSIGRTMHKSNEMIEVKNIEKLTQIYTEFLNLMFK